MSTLIFQNCSEIAREFRESSAISATSANTPRTLSDLLSRWAQNPPVEERMLCTTCGRLADYLQQSLEDISIDEVFNTKRGFRPFLVSRKYEENSVRTYVNHVRLLLKYSGEAGWKSGESFSEEWRRVFGMRRLQK